MLDQSGARRRSRDEMEEGWEGCLSVPGMRGVVPRYTQAALLAASTSRASPSSARSRASTRAWCSTKCDHLDGILYPMRIRDMTQLRLQRSAVSRAGAACEEELRLQLVQQLLLELQHRLRIGERFPRDQEHVLGAVAEGVDARGLQVDVVARERARHAVEQAGAVARRRSTARGTRRARPAGCRPPARSGNGARGATGGRRAAAPSGASRLQLGGQLGLDHARCMSR